MSTEATGRSLGKAIGWAIAFVVVGLLFSAAGFYAMVILLGGDLGAEATNGGLVAGLTNAQATLAQGVGFSVGFGLATWVIGVRSAGLGWEELRWRGTGAPLRSAALGFALGGVASALAMLLAVPLAGGGWLRDAGGPLAWLGTAGLSTAVLVPSALWEELVFRGVPLVLLAGAVGRVPASVVTALAFGWLHGNNPSVTPLALVNIGLAGLFLAAAFWAPGGIWTATGAHLGWNALIAALDAPVSGIPFAMPFLDYEPGAPAWLTGGSFGPEGGALATLTILGATAAAVRWTRKGRVA